MPVHRGNLVNTALWWIGSDGAGRIGASDDMTGALPTINYAHRAIHEGSAFSFHHHKPVYTAGAPTYFLKTETINVCFHTPAGTNLLHMVALVDCSKIAFFRLISGVTVTNASGSDGTILNRDHGSAAVSVIDNAMASPTANRVRTDATFTGGTVQRTETLGEGTGQTGVGIASRDLSEFILAPDTNYAAEITRPDVAGNGIANLLLTWYEQTNIL